MATTRTTLEGPMGRRSLALALALALAARQDRPAPAGPSSAAAATALEFSAVDRKRGPPTPHRFGPDSYATGTFTGEAITSTGLDCSHSTPVRRDCRGFLA